MPKLFMLLIGSSPAGRRIEQHDIFFGIGESIKELVPAINDFWPEVKNKMHIDGWRQIETVDGHRVTVTDKKESAGPIKLFFINLGGYKKNEFEEFHYKMVVAAADKGAAVRQSKVTAFYRHTGFKGAESHVDDKYGIDVDDIFEITDILNPDEKTKFSIIVHSKDDTAPEDELHLGYFKLGSFK